MAKDKSSSSSKVTLDSLSEAKEDGLIETPNALKLEVTHFGDHAYVGDNMLEQEAIVKMFLKQKSLHIFMSEKWRSISTTTPHDIHVWRYQGRPDLMRAVIIGKHGTTFQHAFFIFDFHIGIHFPMIPIDITLRGGFPGFQTLAQQNEISSLEGMCKYSVLNALWSAPVDILVRRSFLEDLSKVQNRNNSLLDILLSLQSWIQSGCFSLLDTWVGPSHSWDAQDVKQICTLMSFKSIILTLKSPLPQLIEFVHRYFLEHRKEILQICESYVEDELSGTQAFRHAMYKILPELREVLP